MRLLAVVLALAATFPAAAQDKKPNVLFILADDLGYGDLGSYGQKKIKTPNLDRLAERGQRFTQYYAGSTVCAPSRCVLMTGLHTGHCTIRGNARVPLRRDDLTVATLMKSAGYITGLIGKWGLGEPDTTGIPNRQGFDYFFGYLNQHHAHNYYPDYLWRNEQKVLYPENVVANNVASKQVTYSHDLFAKEAVAFVEKNKSQPFFLYLALTIPHANNEAGPKGMEVPSDEPYSKEEWPQPQKNHAAMITRMDRDLGALFAKLDQLGLTDNTLIFFSSDNGPHKEGGGDPAFFRSSGPLRGFKRSLHDGGIRVPFIVAWPGKIKPGVNDHVGYFADLLPTVAEAVGHKIPTGLDGISILPTLLGKEQKQHPYLYWEFTEGGFQQALRLEHWRAIRKNQGPVELYDLKADLGETTDVAATNPNVVAQVEAIFRTARFESPDFPSVPTKKK